MLQSAADIPTSFAGRFDRLAERTIAPHWAARLTARLRARQLDRQLIAGADPARSRQLAARACLLTSSQNRTTLALALERLLVSACEPANFWGVAPLRRAVLDRADELIWLASLLRSNSPLYARGIAMVGRLLSDGTGPAYVGPAEALDERLWQARRALTA